MINERMQAAIKELEETAITMTHLQARHSELLKDHIEWLHTHDKAIAETRQADAERGRALDERIQKLVSAIGEFIARQK
jgi:hypothetical protein